MMQPYVALKASAGSGKTFALSVRYIALLLADKPANPNSIMALTFTKKAASEMSSRIISTFLNLNHKQSELAEIAKLLDIDESEVLRRRDALKDSFLGANLKIMTFDAFFGLILRLFSLNSGLSPDYKSVSSVNSAINAQFVKEVSKDKNLLLVLAMYIIGFSKSNSSFFQLLESFYENFGEIKESKTNFPSQSKVMSIVHWFRDKICSKDGASDSAKKLFDIKDVDELLQKNFLSRESLDGYRTLGKVYEDEFDIKFAQLKDELRAYANELEAYKKGEIAKFLRIYKSVRENFGAKLNELSFCDVTKRVHELLCDDANSKQMLYFRLDATITHLLIDEFQDTNVDQYDIMRPLIEEIISGSGQNGIGSFFYVGDTKQSIYRFRGGKKELFDKLKTEFSQIQSQSLTHNYRSAKRLVEYVNFVFQKSTGIGLFDDSEAQIPASKDEGYIEVCQSDELVLECVKKVRFLMDSGVNMSDISVLCWKNSDVRKICEQLRKEGIEARDEGGMLLKNDASVFALINYAKFCLFGDKIYFQNAKSYLDTKLVKLNLDPKKSAASSLYYLAKKANMEISNANLLRLFELASEQSSLIKFIFEFEHSDTLIAQNSHIGVRVMTVHKSKGLEFLHVILCDRIGKAQSDTSGFICEYDQQDGWRISLKLANRENFDASYKALKAKSQEFDRDDEINKLYVAMTRAKNSLVIIKKQNPSGTNPSYFTKYSLKSGEEIKYLDLDCFSDGKIAPSPKAEILPKVGKKIEILAVKKDESVGKNDTIGQNLSAIYFGNALHFLLEMCEDFSENSVKKAAIIMRNKFAKFLPKESMDDVLVRALRFVIDSKFAEILDNAKIYKEQPLIFGGVQKQLDLLCEKEGEVIVVDYKSSEFAVDKNIEQVREYVQILGQIFQGKRVRGALFYLLKDRIKFIEIPL
ncbi:RecB-like helicase [Campylobacter sp. 9BO]|uniref:RecB-like helicase n=1 Tax=Campylobacter sp. 9BO TaxID=3424759 RepID=UPI003D34D522